MAGKGDFNRNVSRGVCLAILVFQATPLQTVGLAVRLIIDLLSGTGKAKSAEAHGKSLLPHASSRRISVES